MIGNGKLQNAVTRAYTPTFDKEPKKSAVPIRGSAFSHDLHIFVFVVPGLAAFPFIRKADEIVQRHMVQLSQYHELFYGNFSFSQLVHSISNLRTVQYFRHIGLRHFRFQAKRLQTAIIFHRTTLAPLQQRGTPHSHLLHYLPYITIIYLYGYINNFMTIFPRKYGASSFFLYILCYSIRQ